jgi:antitoxin (DNA-binding transcriptional repressor) of toxin-antitoxin stability system
VYVLVYTLNVDVNVTELRRRILSLIEDLPDNGILITKRGQPRARLVPVKRRRKGRYVTGPIVPAKGLPGPLCPDRCNPYDVLFG